MRKSISCPLWVWRTSNLLEFRVTGSKPKTKIASRLRILKRIKCQFWTSNAREFWKANFYGSFDLDLCLIKSLAWKVHHYLGFIVFEKLLFQKIFRPYEKENQAFLNSSCLKNVLKKNLFSWWLVVDGRPNRRDKILLCIKDRALKFREIRLSYWY